jgi:hypothetical protein
VTKNWVFDIQVLAPKRNPGEWGFERTVWLDLEIVRREILQPEGKLSTRRRRRRRTMMEGEAKVDTLLNHLREFSRCR